jgi:two-component system alkaline phosphatase synthesis response regulator PhoP
VKENASLGMTQRILVVDENHEIVGLLRTCLEDDDYEVLAAGDGQMALDMLRRERPDLVLLNLVLPDRRGQRGAQVMRPDVDLAAMPLMMLMTPAEGRRYGQLPSAGLEPGADETLAGSFDPLEVAGRVRAVLRRLQAESDAKRMIQIKQLTLDLDARRAEVGGREVSLTPTEFALLCALAEQPGRALTRQEMIENGLGFGYEGAERTVDSHVKNLRRKLEDAAEAAHLVGTVFGVGYRLVVEGDA